MLYGIGGPAMPENSPLKLHRTSFFLTAKQHARLGAIHEATGIPVAVLLRKAVDQLLAQYEPPAPGRKGGKR
jgi:hypothetical protein